MRREIRLCERESEIIVERVERTHRRRGVRRKTGMVEEIGEGQTKFFSFSFLENVNECPQNTL